MSKWIKFQDTYIKVDAIETINRYTSDNQYGISFIVTFSTSKMCFSNNYKTAEERDQYFNRLLELCDIKESDVRELLGVN